MPPTSICRHIHSNGSRCEAVSITGSNFCYWHRDITRRHRELRPDLAAVLDNIPEPQRDPASLKRDQLTAQYYGLKPVAPAELDFPALEDAESIQIALSLVLNSLAQNAIDLKRAGKLLNGLGIASSNVRRIQHLKQHSVRDIVLDETGNPIAPEAPQPAGQSSPTPPAAAVACP